MLVVARQNVEAHLVIFTIVKNHLRIERVRMPDTNLRQTELPDSSGNEPTEPGLLRIAEKIEPAKSGASIPSAEARLATPPSPRAMERPGTIEHLAARRLAPELDAEAPAI